MPIRRTAPVPTDRNFTPDQGLIRGRGRKRARNVLNRMEEIEGPLAVLRQCQKDNTRVKVYTRNQNEIRGLVTGYVVAFDKHWNLALRDVDEIFQKKLRCKTPALGDVSNFVNIEDLTIREGENSSDSDSEDEELGMASMKRQGIGPSGLGFGGAGGSHSGQYGEEEQEEAGPSTSSSTSSSYAQDPRLSDRSRGGKATVREKKKMEFVGPYSIDSLDQRARLSRPVSREHPLTSEAQDALRLTLSQRKQHDVEEQPKEEGEEDEEEQEVKSKKRIRKRKKREIRKRHVNQLFIRGENVVLINVVNE